MRVSIVSLTVLILLSTDRSVLADPVEVPAYHTVEAGKPLVLVPIETYRKLVKGGERSQSAPVLKVKALPLKNVDRFDRIRRTSTRISVDADRAEVTMEVVLDLGVIRNPDFLDVELLAATRDMTQTRSERLVPLLDAQEMIVTGASVPGRVIRTESGYGILTRDVGQANVRLDLSARVTESRGQSSLSVPLPVAAQQSITLVIQSDTRVKVELEGGIISHQSYEKGQTQIDAVGLGADSLKVSWESSAKVKEREDFARARLNAKPELSGTVRTAVSVGVSSLRARSQVQVEVRQNPISVLDFMVPSSVEILDVSGDKVKEWEPTASGVQVRLIQAIQDAFELEFDYEMEVKSSVRFSPVSLGGAYYERHELGFKSPPNILLEIDAAGSSFKGLDSARCSKEFQDLIGDALARTYALERFSASTPDGGIDGVNVSVKGLDRVSLMQATIDLADAVTLITQEGHVLGRITYSVKNNTQQFLRVKLPRASKSAPEGMSVSEENSSDGVRILTVYVGQNAVTAARAGPHEIVVPLAKSARTPSGAAPFNVEITYVQESHALAPGLALRLELPKADLDISTLRWKVGIPQGWALIPQGGNLRHESDYRPVRFEGEAQAGGGQDAFAMFNEYTLPLKVDWPQGFTEFYFSRDLIEAAAEDSPQVDFTVSQTTQGMVRRALAFLAGILIFYLILRRPWSASVRTGILSVGVLGTAILMGLFPWVGSTVGIFLHGVLGVFVGCVVFGLTRLAAWGSHGPGALS